jgi:hypothetical protein
MEGTSTNAGTDIKSNIESERIRLYEKYRDHMIELQKLNSQNFDKAILSLSTTTLGLSLAFIKDIVNLENAACISILKLSWIALVLAIIITLLSFLFSQSAITKQLEYADEYYLQNKDASLEKTNCFDILNRWSAYFSALFFILGIILTVIFVQSNI